MVEGRIEKRTRKQLHHKKNEEEGYWGLSDRYVPKFSLRIERLHLLILNGNHMEEFKITN